MLAATSIINLREFLYDRHSKAGFFSDFTQAGFFRRFAFLYTTSRKNIIVLTILMAMNKQ